MALMAFRTAWVDAVAPVKATIRNLFRDEVAAYLTLAELRAKDTGATRLILIGGVPYLLDAADTISPDNGFSIVTSNDGHRYKIVTGFREKLTANRTYYVRSDGSDTNDGLDNSASRAFLTIQKAIDVVSALDTAIYSITIEVANGVYDGITLKSYVGSGPVTISGNVATPANVVISKTAGGHAISADGVNGRWVLRGLKVQVSGGFGYGILALNGSKLQLGSFDFGACTGDHTYCEGFSVISLTSSYSITGGAGAHYNATTGGAIRGQSITVTLTGTPAFSTAFALANRWASIIVPSNTYTGSATGTRYLAQEVSLIYTVGGASYFPGSVAGSESTNGKYV